MKYLAMLIKAGAALLAVSSIVFSQSNGDWRSHQSGSWGNDTTWEQYNGSTWVWPAPAVPDSFHATTIRTGDSVTVEGGRFTAGNGTIQSGAKVIVKGISDTTVGLTIANGTMTVQGTLVQTDTAATMAPYAVYVDDTGVLIIDNGGTFQQDQNGGQIPDATWNDGSTFYVTGVTSNTNPGSNSRQSLYNIVWNCPNQSANANFGFNPTAGNDTTSTIRGSVTIVSTGVARAYVAGPPAGSAGAHTVARVIINGNVSVLNGSIFSSNGTSSAYTDIFVTVLGNVTVKDSFQLPSLVWQYSQLSISRGSQGTTGSATWFFKGDSVIYGRKTTNQNSTDANTAATTKGRFIFCKPGLQVVRLDDSVAWSGECNMQFGDSVTTTTIDAGNSPFGGSACTQRITPNATVILGADGYIGGGTNSNSIPSSFTMDDGASLVLASENGIRATNMGSSGAVRVSGNRDYGTSSDFKYNGTADQRLGSGFPATAHNLVVDNAAGVYVDSVSAFTISSLLSVINGDLDLNGCTITLGSSALLSETPGNTVKGDSGVITTTRTLTAPSVSTNIAGMGVSIGSSADLGSTVITRGHARQSGNGHTGIRRYFDLTPTTNTGLDATLLLRYDASELDGQDPNIELLWKSEDGGSTWSYETATNDPGQHTLTVTGVNALSRWTGSDAYNGLGPGGRTVVFSAGWNMLSLPWVIADRRKTTLFPSATSEAFTYEGLYTAKETLQYGSGYWMKFTGSGIAVIPGTDTSSLTFDVRLGWNMIGSVSFPVDVSTITSNPPGMITSSFFGYADGYQTTDTLLPGGGYWVKVNQAGQLTLNGSPSARPEITSRIRIEPRISDLPPAPPGGGGEITTAGPLPQAYSLGPCYPNPFNPTTTLRFGLPEEGRVEITVYSLLGQKVRTLLNEVQGAGYHAVTWNGMTDDLKPAGSGVYLIRMVSGSFSSVQKVMMMK